MMHIDDWLYIHQTYKVYYVSHFRLATLDEQNHSPRFDPNSLILQIQKGLWARQPFALRFFESVKYPKGCKKTRQRTCDWKHDIGTFKN